MQRTVLVVDDSPDIRLCLRWVLGREGFEVFTAENGADGLDIATQSLPDLILLDLQMPRMDGRETIRHLRERQATRLTPVIAYTGDVLCPLGQSELIQAGFTAYVSKDTSIPDLLEVLTSVMR